MTSSRPESQVTFGVLSGARNITSQRIQKSISATPECDGVSISYYRVSEAVTGIRRLIELPPNGLGRLTIGTARAEPTKTGGNTR
jgi:hypothetical protein